MTKQLLSTTEINIKLKKSLNMYLSANDLMNLGFQPEFETANARYWPANTAELAIQKIKELPFDSMIKAKPEKTDTRTFEQGYQAGYKARSKKEWHSLTDNEAQELIHEAYAQDDWVFDIGWLIHSIEQLLKNKNHG